MPALQLADTRSTYDKKQTLLHYIAHVVEKLYPHQLSFYDDLDIDEAAKGVGREGATCILRVLSIHDGVTWSCECVCFSVEPDSGRGCAKPESGAGGREE